MSRFILLLAGILLAGPASAHGDADWIRQGDYRTKVGTTCCTEKDCGIIYPRVVAWEADAVRIVFERDGALIELRVPKEAVRPNPHDLDVWLCALPHEIASARGRCLFLPMTAGEPL